MSDAEIAELKAKNASEIAELKAKNASKIAEFKAKNEQIMILEGRPGTEEKPIELWFCSE